MSPNLTSASLNSKAMLVSLTISQWTARKFDKKVTEEVRSTHNAGDAGRYNKLLIANEAIKEVTKATSEARVFHYTNTLPWTDDGARILPAANYLSYCEGMRKCKAQFERAVAKFLSNYDGLKEEARVRLNTMFNEADYPDEKAIRRKYDLRTSVLPLPSASDFRVDLQEEEVEEIQRNIEERMQNAQNKAMRDLFFRLKEALDRMVERLSDPENVFRDSLVGNLVELVNLLPRLNLTDDPNLENVRREIESKLTRHAPDSLRVDPHLRKEVATDAKDILDRMSFFFPPSDEE